MKQKIRNIINNLKASQTGVFVVEYALLLPVFMAITLGSLEIGRILMVNAALEGAITESTRISITGNIPDGYTTVDEYIKDYVQSSLGNVGVDAGVTISMKVYESFSAIGAEEPYTDSNTDNLCNDGEFYTDVNANGQWDADMGATGAGGEENIMVMEIAIDLPYMMAGIVSSDDSIVLASSTAVRNEPYGGTAWTPSDNVQICT